MFKYLYKPIVLNQTSRLDERYFEEKEDGIYLKPIAIYIILKDAQNYFKKLVFQLDSSFQYHSEKEKEVEDIKAKEEAKSKYQKQFDEMDKLWQEYKNTHKDEFQEQYNIDRQMDEDTRENFSRMTPDINFSLQDAIQGYKCSGELLKQYGKGTDEYNALPKYVSMVSKSDFKDSHKKFREELYKKVGLPSIDNFIFKKVETRPTISVRKVKAEDYSPLEQFAEEYAQFLNEI